MDDIIENYVKERTKSAKDLENFKFQFGKYKGVSVVSVFREDPQYLKFAFEKAKYRLSPAIHRFIVDNSSSIAKGIRQQERAELDVFADFESEESDSI